MTTQHQTAVEAFRQLGHPQPEAAVNTQRKVAKAHSDIRQALKLQDEAEFELHVAPVAPGMVFRVNNITATVNSVSPRLVWDKQGRPSWQVMATILGSDHPRPFSLVHGFFSLESRTPGV